MSFLDKLNKAEDWLIRNTMGAAQGTTPPSNNDAILTMAFFVAAMLVTVATCGHCLGK